MKRGIELPQTNHFLNLRYLIQQAVSKESPTSASGGSELRPARRLFIVISDFSFVFDLFCYSKDLYS